MDTVVLDPALESIRFDRGFVSDLETEVRGGDLDIGMFPDAGVWTAEAWIKDAIAVNEAFAGWVGRDGLVALGEEVAATVSELRGAGWVLACGAVEALKDDGTVLAGVFNERPDFILATTESSTSSSVSESITIKSSSTPVSELPLKLVVDRAVA